MKYATALLGLLLVGCSTREVVLYGGSNGLTACGDSGTDATADATSDAGSDAIADAGTDDAAEASADVATDMGSDVADAADAASEAQESSTDTGTDSGDAPSEAVADVTSEATADASGDAAHEAEAGSAPYVRQWGNQVWNPSAGTGENLSVTLTNTLPGSSVLVFVTEYNVSGSPAGTGPLSPVTISDTASSAYVGPLDSVNSPPDYQGIMSFVATSVAPTASLTVRAAFVSADEWTGVIAIEIANASRVVAHGGNEMFNASGHQVMNGPALAVGSAPALVIGLYANGFDNSAAPGIGSGWTSIGGAWNWGGLEGTATTPSTLLESRLASGNVTPTAIDLETTNLQEDFLILAAALE